MTKLLNNPPAILYRKEDIVPPKKDPKVVLKSIISNASLEPNIIRANKEIEFARPNFIPGTPDTNTGS